MGEMIKIIRCTSCDSNIKIDLDNLISYCPYCGSTLMLDVETIQELLIEKERTKQIMDDNNTDYKIFHERNEIRRERRQTSLRFWTFYFGILILAMILVLILFYK